VITTPDLIESLAANAIPVRRLHPPLARTALWLLLSLAILVLFGVAHGVRANLLERLQEPAFATGMAASLLTGILAAMAAFMVSLPDRSRLWLLLPVPSLAVWLATIGYGCLTNWVKLGPDGVRAGATLECFATLVLISVPLFLAMLMMLRHAAPVRPMAVTMAGGLAVAAITATALALFHELDATIMILVWNLGAATLVVGVASAIGRKTLSWVTPRATLRRS
jgi:hypothetical protein